MNKKIMIAKEIASELGGKYKEYLDNVISNLQEL